MDIIESIESGRSCSDFKDEPICGDVLSDLESSVDYVCELSGLDIRLAIDNAELFDVADGGNVVRGCSNGILFAARDGSADESLGYWGQQIVVFLQSLGLSACWTDAFAASKLQIRIPEGESFRVAIAIGYAADGGATSVGEEPLLADGSIDVPYTIEDGQSVPAWFETGMRAVQLAPRLSGDSDMRFTLHEDAKTVDIQVAPGGWHMIDKGIARCNFELAASTVNPDWEWAEPLPKIAG